MKTAITITYGDQAENHAGMQRIGSPLKAGLTIDDILTIRARLNEIKMMTEIVTLGDDACVLVVRNAVVEANAIYTEQMALPWDKKVLNRGRVVDKKARHNLCYGPEAQVPDYDAGLGRIIAFADVPYLARVRGFIELLPPAFAGLVAEGNHYHNPKSCGIGFHGDTERKVVVAVRLGQPIPLVFQQFVLSRPVGEPIVIKLGHGDLYVMSARAVGYDWQKCGPLPHWRHAAGARMYTTPTE